MSPETTVVLATEAHLLEILAWLKQEERETGEGFYCNREIIVESQQQGEVCCAVVRSTVVGFVVQTRKSVGASIDILEVKPQCRGQGFGKMLALGAIERLFESGAEFITVRCAPRSSERFWKSLGFQPTGAPQRSIWDNPRLVLQRGT
mgnify:CR=1 FL=1